MLERLKKRIKNREARVGIVGLGYVGLPLAVAFAKAGFQVTGIDVDAKRAAKLNAGRSYILDVASSEVAAARRSGRLHATADWGALSSLDAIVICVPTPLGKTNKPDVSYVLAVTRQVAKHLRCGQLVVLESTSYPGTTDELMLSELKKQNPALHVDKDFYLAFSPERVDPGNRRFVTTSIPKVVGGVGKASGEAAKVLYSSIISKIVPVSSARAAEMVKLLENTFRNVNIAFANEMAKLCHHFGVDVWEVIEAAKTKPFGFMPFYPGPGLGGHCIPVDPHYLYWKSKERGYDALLIKMASEINESMPLHVVDCVRDILNDGGRPLKNARVLILGVSYKPDVDDLRESPALEVIEHLVKAGAKVEYADPYVPRLEVDGLKLAARALTPALLKRQNCAVVVTNHSAFDYSLIQRHSKLVFDTRNAMRAHAGKSNVKFL